MWEGRCGSFNVCGGNWHFPCYSELVSDRALLGILCCIITKWFPSIDSVRVHVL